MNTTVSSGASAFPRGQPQPPRRVVELEKLQECVQQAPRRSALRRNEPQADARRFSLVFFFSSFFFVYCSSLLSVLRSDSAHSSFYFLDGILNPNSQSRFSSLPLYSNPIWRSAPPLRCKMTFLVAVFLGEVTKWIRCAEISCDSVDLMKISAFWT